MVLVLVASVALYCIVVDNIGIGTAVVQKHTEHTGGGVGVGTGNTRVGNDAAYGMIAGLSLIHI